ncbi:MAG TPA: hypothetical protein VMN78_02425 [Longimicrobiales bacterium]|nr:hypothetical protein [Longimicrobiales bacterium]
MLLTLTDHLTCPSCGPDAGLILLMEDIDDRRVRTGALGCPVCRARYVVVEGVADLRASDAGTGAGAGAGVGAGAGAGAGAGVDADARDLALRMGGLLGLGEGSGFVLVDGPAGLAVAAELAGLLPDYEMVVPIPEARRAAASGAGLSALLESGRLPIATRTMQAAAYIGVPDGGRVLELLRVCRPTGRVVVELGGAEDGGDAALDRIADLLEGAGARVRARDGSGLVAVVL